MDLDQSALYAAIIICLMAVFWWTDWDDVVTKKLLVINVSDDPDRVDWDKEASRKTRQR